MGLIIRDDIEVKEFNLSPPKFVEEERVFSLESSKGIVKIPYFLQVDQSWSANPLDIYLFVNPAVQENDIFRVRDGESQEIIGWLFPIQALLSTEHDYAGDTHFLRCAFVTFQKLLQGEGLLTKKPIFKGEQITALDFYDDNDIILVLGRNEINKIKDFQIQSFFPCLFKYGYRYKNKIETAGRRISKFYEEIDKDIKLYKISGKLTNNTYIYDLFTDVLDDNNIVHTFLSLYQVIEIIIFDIFRDELGKCLEDYSKLHENDCDSFFDLGERLNSIRKEKTRIIDLFKHIDACPELQSLCNNLLVQLGFKPEGTAAKAFYAVRNNLVHSYRLFSAPQKKSLEDIVEEFIGVVVNLLISYKK